VFNQQVDKAAWELIERSSPAQADALRQSLDALKLPSNVDAFMHEVTKCQSPAYFMLPALLLRGPAEAVANSITNCKTLFPITHDYDVITAAFAVAFLQIHTEPAQVLVRAMHERVNVEMPQISSVQDQFALRRFSPLYAMRSLPSTALTTTTWNLLVELDGTQKALDALHDRIQAIAKNEGHAGHRAAIDLLSQKRDAQWYTDYLTNPDCRNLAPETPPRSVFYAGVLGFTPRAIPRDAWKMSDAAWVALSYEPPHDLFAMLLARSMAKLTLLNEWLGAFQNPNDKLSLSILALKDAEYKLIYQRIQIARTRLKITEEGMGKIFVGIAEDMQWTRCEKAEIKVKASPLDYQEHAWDEDRDLFSRILHDLLVSISHFRFTSNDFANSVEFFL
jgi:hypothetical protein